MSRPLAALASVILTVGGLVFLLPPQCAYACSCAPGSIQRYLSSSEAVFSGEVVEIEKGYQKSRGYHNRVTLRASEVWKGPQRETLEVSTPRDGATCGYPFKEGQEYLVFADEGKQGLQVNSCAGTRRLTEAQVDLEVLGASKKPTGGEALSDTSGGVSAGTMVGVAGLALAASFLVVVRLLRTGQESRIRTSQNSVKAKFAESIFSGATAGAVVATLCVSTNADQDNGITLQRTPRPVFSPPEYPMMDAVRNASEPWSSNAFYLREDPEAWASF